jgi:hypothetical protein
MREYPKLFPRPNFNTVPQGKGYDFRQQRQPAPQRNQPAKGGNDMSRMTDAQLRALIARGQ